MMGACPTKVCEVCGAIFAQGKDEGPKRFANRRYCSRTCGATTHSLSRSPEYRVWLAMLNRCELSTDSAYDRYGARGISVCASWHDFMVFYRDMGARPTPRHSIDRIDGTKGYSPSNCRWATRREQQNNIKSNVRLTVRGATLTVSEWERRMGYGRIIESRLRRGWTSDEAVLTPPRVGNKPKDRVPA